MPQREKAKGWHAISLRSKYTLSDLPQTRDAVSARICRVYLSQQADAGELRSMAGSSLAPALEEDILARRICCLLTLMLSFGTHAQEGDYHLNLKIPECKPMWYV